MTDIATLIQSVGFPIAAFLLMWYQSNTTIKENTEAINKMIDHLSQMKGGDS